MFVTAVLAFLLLASGLIILTQHGDFRAELAKIEQLRKDSETISVGSDEAVMGLVVEANINIAQKQCYNKLWWSCLFVPNEWDEIEKIKINLSAD